jgi:hypothetical protein
VHQVAPAGARAPPRGDLSTARARKGVLAMRVLAVTSVMILGSVIGACQVGDDRPGDDPGAPIDPPIAPAADPAAGPQAGADHRGYIRGMDGRPVEIGYTVTDGWAYQDDIGLGPADQIAATAEELDARSAALVATPAAMTSGPGGRWPGGILYYQLDPTLSDAVRTRPRPRSTTTTGTAARPA